MEVCDENEISLQTIGRKLKSLGELRENWSLGGTHVAIVLYQNIKQTSTSNLICELLSKLHVNNEEIVSDPQLCSAYSQTFFTQQHSLVFAIAMFRNLTCHRSKQFKMKLE